MGPALNANDCGITIAVQSDPNGFGLPGDYAKVNIKVNDGKKPKNCYKPNQAVCPHFTSVISTESAISNPTKIKAFNKDGLVVPFLNWSIPFDVYTLNLTKCYGYF